MSPLSRDFISDERRTYSFKFGTLIASSLSGFIAGAIAASVAWMLYILVQK